MSKGDTITLFARVQGEPAPLKGFYYGRIEIKACPSVEVIEKEHSLKLIMSNARRDDTGIYTLKADNDHGQDQADVEVVVMVAPTKPRGPLKVDNIYAEGNARIKAPSINVEMSVCRMYSGMGTSRR